MVFALAYFLSFQAIGVFCVRCLMPRRKALDRIWLGMSLGLLEQMWFPALVSFFLPFQVQALLIGMAAGLVSGGACWLIRDRRAPRKWEREDSGLLRQMLWFCLPLLLLSGWLQYTHMMRVDADGNWHVGQSTYGDLPMHLSFITGFAGKKMPLDYPFYPGHRLSYPFLTDSLSTSFYVLGCSLQAAVILPGTYMMLLCYMGVLILGREMTAGKKTALLAAALFFFNGGLGFLYDFDQAAGFNSSGGLNVTDRIRHILEGYYKTPTNQPEPNNLRWSNVICDLMIPQRTLLGGWAMGIPCFYLLETVFRPDFGEKDAGVRGEALLGLWAGALPLIHTHTFVALALSSAGVMGYDLIHAGKGERARAFRRYLLYGGAAALLALPQLVGFTFAQTFQGQETSQGFIRFQFNWVNNPSGRGMRDFYLWFYVKNIGLPFLMLLLAAFERDAKQRRLFSGMMLIVAAAELIRFQPNEYDNNKLLYLAWMIGCMIVSNWASRVWGMLRGLRGRGALAAGTALAVFLSPALTIARECVSDYQAFSAASVAAGEYVREETPEDAVFLTGTQHLNPVSSIAGRTIVCGPDLWLYWHGFDTGERKLELTLFYENPAEHPEVLSKYGVDYIYVSSYERNSYDVDEAGLKALYDTVFENTEAAIYRVSTGK